MTVVARTVLREQVKDVLLERILEGEYAPGDRLIETRIRTSRALSPST